MPSKAKRVAIVFAVNCPPHAPAPGTRGPPGRRRSPSVILARGVSADGFEHVWNRDVAPVEPARSDRSAIEHQRGHVEPRQRHDRAGDCLVAARERHDAVEQVAIAKSSIESAMTSRDTSEARIPSVPIEMPSEMAIVLNSMGVPPASRMPSLTFSARARRCTLHGVTSVQVLATPTRGFSRSASV
jgi:hypothetical protein